MFSRTCRKRIWRSLFGQTSVAEYLRSAAARSGNGRNVDCLSASGGLFLGLGFLEDPHDVAFLHDEVLDAIDLDLGARPLTEQDAVADMHVQRNQLPDSSRPPGPTAMISPWEGFSLAVSGMMMPPALLSSASMRLTTTRS